MLERLAEANGIALQYSDIWGTQHRTAAYTLRALLAAMSVPVATDAEAEQALARLQQTHPNRAIPAVLVVRRGDPIILRLGFPIAFATEEVVWRLVEEGGAEHVGKVILDAQAQERSEGEPSAFHSWLLPHEAALGYHRLIVAHGAETLGETLLIVAPAKCYRPRALEDGGRVWGPAVQLYGLRSERNWGIGDFTDLATLAEQWVSRGAALIAVNPLHALFAHRPAHASPYSPSSRLFFNTLYLDIEQIDDFRESPEAGSLLASQEFQAALAKARAVELVDYPAVAELKSRALALAYRQFRHAHLAVSDKRAAQFHAFCAARGNALERYALFEALQEHFYRDHPSIHGWQLWPEPFRDPGSAAVERFGADHRERVEYYQYLQWQAALQLDTVAQRIRDAGAAIGLYADLAVSIDRAGAEAWANQQSYAMSANVGAPPDEFNLRGQDWGLPPLIPERLRETGYAPFIAMLRANMRNAAALRIDHVMGLLRLFWIPAGADPVHGAYVGYPFADLLAILALESQRHRCLIIGEDLGTVPDELRETLARAGISSTRLFLFERQASGEFKRPAGYLQQAIVCASTHDLPTLAGWWEGRDLALRAELSLFPDEATLERHVAARAEDRARVLRALDSEGLLPPGVGLDPAALRVMTREIALALHSFLARTPSEVMLVQLEDVIGVREQANLPATVDEHPNWRRKLPLELERWPLNDAFSNLTATLQAERPRTTESMAQKARDSSSMPTRIPRATYRLQLHRDFSFAHATALVPYLAALGVSHVYCSPYLRARAGSRHGYDIVDHAEINPEIGTLADFERFTAELARHGMGQIADVVPNHMGIMGSDNAWWMDVLENGPASRFASFFDIDWNPLDADLAGKVLVPVLGDHYGRVLDRGEIKLSFDPRAGAFEVHYHQHKLPVDPREYPRVLQVALDSVNSALPSSARDECANLTGAFERLPPRSSQVRRDVEQRAHDKEALKARLARLTREHPSVAQAIDGALQTINGTQGKPESFGQLHALLEAQAYRVAYWRVASDSINYRRFFDINELAALSMENESVFEATHRFILELAAAGKIDGLRIDHPDGLFDPARYFQRLQEFYKRLAPSDGNGRDRPLYVVIEKIDAIHEQLPASWRIHGTTGYRFASLLTGLFVDTAASGRVDRTWRAFVGEAAVGFDDIAYHSRRLVMRSALQAELSVLSNRLLRIAHADRNTRDLTLSSLRDALTEITACFPVYRTYVAQRASAQDRRYIDWGTGGARRRSRAADPSVFSFVRDVLLLRPPDGAPKELKEVYRSFAMRFQQFTAPVMAKGVEDTAFYRFNRLVSLNEVGGAPDQFGTTVQAFHRGNLERNARWPHALLAGSTHDNKRSADVRARIDVISEMPAMWRGLVRHWRRLNRRHMRVVDEEIAPSPNDEYLLYQTLIGTFPVGDGTPGLSGYRERIASYMIKAAREAKVCTSWVSVNDEYESALTAFVAGALEESATNLFIPELRTKVAAFAWFGALNSVSMALLHCTSPGVPDIYQGSELMELSLVDPDNRRPVDYAIRREALEKMQALERASAHELSESLKAVLSSPHDGLLKLWVITRALELRRKSPKLFSMGDYVAIAGAGERARHVIAFARRHEEGGALAIAGRLFAALGVAPGAAPIDAEVWSDTRLELPFALPSTQLTDVLTGETIDVASGTITLARVFARLPCALLTW
ncbi:MAG: malto-oligosyltrehalose synthase [Betaproteobacteria bacterium]|nr:MAG: malto-oligosyltrehalose synthase [Betaproteobacteria bacterium]